MLEATLTIILIYFAWCMYKTFSVLNRLENRLDEMIEEAEEIEAILKTMK